MQLANASSAMMGVTASMASIALSTKDTWSIRRNCRVNEKRLTNHPAKDIKEENMRISYYNLDKDEFNKKHSRFKKKKLFTIWFNHILENIQFENSDRGLLLWVDTPKTIRVFGYWKQGGCGGSKKFYQTWTNDHCGCS